MYLDTNHQRTQQIDNTHHQDKLIHKLKGAAQLHIIIYQTYFLDFSTYYYSKCRKFTFRQINATIAVAQSKIS